MKKIYRTSFYPFVLLSTLLLSGQSWSETGPTTDIVEVSLNTGYYNFDEGWDLEDSEFLGWGLGLQWNRQWRSILNYSRLTGGDTDDVAGLKIQKYQADVSYSFNTEGVWRPYLVASYGEIDFTTGGDDKQQKQDEQLGLGTGISYKISPKLFIHTELHGYYNHRRYHTDIEGKVMLAYRFGRGEQ